MAETIFETPQSLAEHIEISNKTKGLLWKTISAKWLKL
jgi:hypothetical protein